MYNDTLTEKNILIDHLYLDPNNPRFWSEKGMPELPDKKIPEDVHQARAGDMIKNHGLEELKKSVLRNGFLPLDRIVVRELAEVPGKYVAIEGNRRLASVKALRKEINDHTIAETDIPEEHLKKILDSTNSLSVLVYQGSEKDISWILQGIRHIGGIREWSPAQQGKLVADQIDKEHLTLSQAGQRFGLTAQAVGRRYRSYKALEQMRADEEFRPKADNKFYSLFEEAVGKKEVRQWLEWSDEENRFKNQDNTRQFYSWICADDKHPDGARRIHDPRHIKDLAQVLASAKRDVLLNQIDNHELSIETAAHKVKDTQTKFDWKIALEEAGEYLDSIPSASLVRDTTQLLAALDGLQERIDRIRAQVKAVTATETASGASTPPAQI